MKRILIWGIAAVSTCAVAHQNPDKVGQCFSVDGDQSTHPCLIKSGGGVGGIYLDLQFNNKEYLLEKSKTCGGNCLPHLGTIPEDVKEATRYFRSFKDKKVVQSKNSNTWTCYKQNKGKLDVCFVYGK